MYDSPRNHRHQSEQPSPTLPAAPARVVADAVAICTRPPPFPGRTDPHPTAAPRKWDTKVRCPPLMFRDDSRDVVVRRASIDGAVVVIHAVAGYACHRVGSDRVAPPSNIGTNAEIPLNRKKGVGGLRGRSRGGCVRQVAFSTGKQPTVCAKRNLVSLR